MKEEKFSRLIWKALGSICVLFAAYGSAFAIAMSLQDFGIWVCMIFLIIIVAIVYFIDRARTKKRLREEDSI